MSDSHLYEDTFSLTSVDSGNYDRIARVAGTSADSTTIMTLDINTDLFPLSAGDQISLLLASSLNLDGSKEETDGSWRERRGPSLADAWDYVCYGRIYKFDEAEEGEAIKVYVSFGGLLLYIEGPYKKLTPLRIDHIYLLPKR